MAIFIFDRNTILIVGGFVVFVIVVGKITIFISHNNNDYGGRGPSLLLSHSTSGTVGRLVGFFL